MIDLHALQKKVYENKVEKGFNIENIHQEFCLLYEEVGEAYTAYSRKLPDFGEELADVAIFLLGIAELLQINLEDEIKQKIIINKQRTYEIKNGVHIRTNT